MKVTDGEILEFIQQFPEPVVTAKEVADEFGIQRQSAHERLKKLNENNRVERKEVGPAVVWYIDGR